MWVRDSWKWEDVMSTTKRFNLDRILSTPDSRRAYCELIFTTIGIAEFIGGVILQDERIRRRTRRAAPAARGDAAEIEHGHRGSLAPDAGVPNTGGGSSGAVPAPPCPGRGAGDRVPVGDRITSQQRCTAAA
jgi:hypothetical protein